MIFWSVRGKIILLELFGTVFYTTFVYNNRANLYEQFSPVLLLV